MKVALLRVGVDSGCGGMQGPLFRDGSFEYVPIPDAPDGIDPRTYGAVPGRHGRYLVDYFPEARQARMRNESIHFDPEFATFTYGDGTPPKAGLRRLDHGDLLVFYCGLEGWDFHSAPALYLMGFFEVEIAGLACEFSRAEIRKWFSENFHVRHRAVFRDQKDCLVLVRGTPRSRLFRKAHLLSTTTRDRAGHPLKVISPKMRKVFGHFDGKISVQRSPTRWVDEAFVERAARYVRSLK
jgi:hypothetical protein